MDFEGFAYGHDFESPNNSSRTRMLPSSMFSPLFHWAPALPAFGLHFGTRTLIGPSYTVVLLILTQLL